MNSSEDPLECMLCGLRSFSLGRHITAKHSMTVQEYKNKFPGCAVNKLTQFQIEKMKLTKKSKDSKNKILKIEYERRKQEMKDSGLKSLKCQICGFESFNSLISHITRKHNIAMLQYREKYPNDKIQQASPTQRMSNSIAMKEKLRDPEVMNTFLEWRSFPSEEKHWLKKGLSEKEAKEKVAEFQRLQSLKGNNEVTQKKRSEKCSGENNPMSLSSISSRKGVSKKEAKELTPCFGRCGEKHPMFGKKHKDETLRKMGERINHSGRSQIEHEMSNKLISLYGGQKNVGVHGWSCDYVNDEKKLIVEFFGDFWHHNPKKYDKNFVNSFTKRNSSQVWERDARKIRDLSEQGYSVVIVWESDWREDSETCLKEIKNAYDRTL